MDSLQIPCRTRFSLEYQLAFRGFPMDLRTLEWHQLLIYF